MIVDTPKCAANASKLGADPSKGFLVGGSSAGGHASAVLQHLARDGKLEPPLTACWLAYPGTLDVRNIPEKFKSEYTSLEQAAEGPGLNNKGVEFLYSKTSILLVLSNPKMLTRSIKKHSSPSLTRSFGRR